MAHSIWDHFGETMLNLAEYQGGLCYLYFNRRCSGINDSSLTEIIRLRDHKHLNVIPPQGFFVDGWL
jgi:hypothetical protein